MDDGEAEPVCAGNARFIFEHNAPFSFLVNELDLTPGWGLA
jgi:hypothetical protein